MGASVAINHKIIINNEHNNHELTKQNPHLPTTHTHTHFHHHSLSSSPNPLSQPTPAAQNNIYQIKQRYSLNLLIYSILNHRLFLPLNLHYLITPILFIITIEYCSVTKNRTHVLAEPVNWTERINHLNLTSCRVL